MSFHKEQFLCPATGLNLHVHAVHSAALYPAGKPTSLSSLNQMLISSPKFQGILVMLS